MKRNWIALGAITAVLATGMLAAQTVPARPGNMPIAEMLKRLGSDDFALREGAQREIDTLPPSRAGELMLLLNPGDDAELRERTARRVAEVRTSYRFQFGFRGREGELAVRPGDLYQDTIEKPWGFEPGPTLIERFHMLEGNVPGHFVTSDKPFYFSAAVPEGNYRVTVKAGDADGPTDLTVKAELRRFMVERMHLEKGVYQTASFVVNVRIPQYVGGKVSLKGARESVDEAWAWDAKLTLEFNGPHPNVSAVTIEKVDVPTIYLLGDSTMCDQAKEPWNSWGQMLPRFFKDDIAVANHAESGETVASSLAAHRFDKVYSLLKKGDYLFFAFGHNDQKQGGVPLERYKAEYHKIIQQVKAKGATPVVVSSMERMTGITNDTLGEYPAAAKQVAAEEGVPFIDLHAMSRVLYQHLGGDLNAAFAFDAGKQDQTHNSDFGSYEISKLVLEGIRQNKLDLVEHIRADVPVFDPAHPDKFADFKVPASPTAPGATATRPAGD